MDTTASLCRTFLHFQTFSADLTASVLEHHFPMKYRLVQCSAVWHFHVNIVNLFDEHLVHVTSFLGGRNIRQMIFLMLFACDVTHFYSSLVIYQVPGGYIIVWTVGH